MSYLLCLGGKPPELSTETPDVFTRTQPLLLIAYLKHQGMSSRLDVANLFWADIEDKHMRLKRLSEVLRLIANAVPNTIISSSNDKFIHTTVKSDIDDLKQACEEENYEHVIELYRGHFFQGVELNKRLKIYNNEALYEWLLSYRESVIDIVRDAFLSYGELKAAQEDYDTAGTLADKAYKLTTEQSFLLPQSYQRMYTLLVAAKRAEATPLYKEAIQNYSPEEICYFESFQDARSELATPHNLPQVEPLIGRQQELAECSALLLGLSGDVRLVALLGQGGIGKTTLAKELTRRLRGYKLFKDGIFAIWLEHVRDSNEVLEHIARALSLQVPANRLAVDFLSDMLRDKAMLLYLDNMEHLLDANSDIDILLERCPNLKILISSREVYPSDWAQLYSLDGLSFPTEISSDVETALEFAAVELFVTQGKKVNRNFALDADNVADVIAICQQVHGLALAVKLAASWLRTSTPQVIKQELANSFALLDDVQSHQQSLSASLDLSWNRLSEAEHVAFSKLAVFQAGFTLEAVKEIAELELSILKDLQHKSLVEWSDVQERYSLHPLLRSYVKAKCSADDLEVLKLKHSKYYLKLLRVISDGTQEERNRAVRVLKPEVDNIQNAWQVAVDNVELEELKNTAHAVQRFFDEIANVTFGILILENAIDSLNKMDKSHQSTLGSLFANHAWLSLRLAKYQLAMQYANNALDLIEENFEAKSTAINVLAEVNSELRNFEAARNFYLDALELTKDYPGHYASILTNIGVLEKDIGNFDLAYQYFNESLSIRQSNNQLTRLPHLQYLVGLNYLNKDELDQSEKHFKEALELAETLQLDSSINQIKPYLCYVSFRKGQSENIEIQLEDFKRKALLKRNPFRIITIYFFLLEYYCFQGNYIKALSMIEESMSIQNHNNMQYALYKTLIYFLKVSRLIDKNSSLYLSTKLNKPHILEKLTFREKKDLMNLSTTPNIQRNVSKDVKIMLSQLSVKIERWAETHLSTIDEAIC